jgi:hypothetical protein
MSNSNLIIINGLNSRSGGGLVIFSEFLRQRSSFDNKIKYIIFIPNGFKCETLDKNTNVTFIEFPNFINNFILLFFYYYLLLPIFFIFFKPKFILNFGDIVIPYITKQIYFFDWAFALSDKTSISFNLNSITRQLKILQIRRNIINIKKIICQTTLIRDELKLKLLIPNNNLIVLPTPPLIYNDLDKTKILNYKSFNSSTPLILFYPTSLSFHKNIAFLFNLARIINDLKLPVKFKITTNKKDLEKIYPDLKLCNSIELCGFLSHKEVLQQLQDSHFLFFPSLLESYGLPLVEAMSLTKPILVSDLDYAKVLCDDSADYFNPYEVNSAIEIIKNILTGNFDHKVKCTKLKQRFNMIPSWDFFTKELLDYKY